MKIMNESIACNLNWFEFKFLNSNEISSIKLHKLKWNLDFIEFQFQFNWRKIGWKLLNKLLKICSSLSSCVTMVLKKQIGSIRHKSCNSLKSIF
jgi:hypothetical protein